MRYILWLSLTLLAAAGPDDAAADFAAGRWQALYQRFGPMMKTALKVEQLAGLGQFGKCKAPGPAATTQAGPQEFTLHIYRMECEARTFGLRVVTTPEGLVEGLQFVEPPGPAGPVIPPSLGVVTGQYRLPAELKLPAGAGPFPAVVLVHGSGPNDRDETIGPNKPFRDIAEGLAARGIASLRYDKRTKVYGAKLPKDITVREETIDDAVSAVALLRKTAKIDGKKIFVIGHSLGAFVAPRIGAADPAIAGLVLLAGNTRTLDAVIDDQIRYLGASPEDGARLKKAMPEAYWKDLAAYNPVATARALRMPMLILQGERDYQVTMEDFKGWEALRGPRVTLKSYPALNHLFQPGVGKAKPAEYGVAKPFDASVLDDIAAWIRGVK